MAIILNDNLKINAGKPIDSRYLNSQNQPYNSVSDVNNTISISERSIGLTVRVNNVEYWYESGVTNNDLVLKSLGSSSITGATNGTFINQFNQVSLGGELIQNTNIFGLYDFSLNVNNLILSAETNFNLFYNEGVLISSSDKALEYDNDYSNNYNPRSIPDVGFVTGITSQITTDSIKRNFIINNHGFVVGDVIAYEDNNFVKAIADGSQSGETIGLVTNVYDINIFTITFAGYVENLNSLNLSANTTYFLSDSVPGLLTPDEPSIDTSISKPMLFMFDNDKGMVFMYRGIYASNALTLTGGSNLVIGGFNSSIQFNSNGVLSGDTNFLYDYVSKALIFGYSSGQTNNFSASFGGFGYNGIEPNSVDGYSSLVTGFKNDIIGDYSSNFGAYNHVSGLTSSAFGSLNKSYGVSSISHGYYNISLGNYSKTEGSDNISYGNSSHAEGSGSRSYGFSSHAEGISTRSFGNSSHAEGYNTRSIGENSHSEGENTVAVGRNSKASGVGSFSGGYASFNHSINDENQLYGSGSNAEGSVILGGLNHNIESGNTYSVILGGEGINLSGNSYVRTTAVDKLAIFQTPEINNTDDDILVWNSTTKMIERIPKSGITSSSSNQDLLTLSGLTLQNQSDIFDLSGKTLIIGGFNSSIQFNSNGVLSGDTNFLYDYVSKALIFGYSSGQTNNFSASFGGFGYNGIEPNIVEGYSSFITGFKNDIIGDYSSNFGAYNQVSGLTSSAFGSLNKSYGVSSISHGYYNTSLGNYSKTEGRENISYGNSSHAEGSGSRSYGFSSHAEGISTRAFGDSSHAEGYNTRSIGENSHSEGENTVAVGRNSKSSGVGSFAGGYSSFNHSINDENQVYGSGSNAEGSVILGGLNNNIESGNTYSVVLGGEGINLTGNTYVRTTAVDKLAIFQTPKINNTDDDILVWNSSTKMIDKTKKGLSFINYYDFTSQSVTNIVSGDTWYKLNTNTTLGFSRNGLTHTNNRATYTGNTKIFKIEGILSVSSGNNNEIHVGFFRNNTLYASSEQSVITSVGDRADAIPFQSVIELENGDFVEVWVKNVTSTTNITLRNLNVIVLEI